jgi:hypothetical protein
VHQEDDFVLDVRGMLSYGDAVKEKTFGFGSRGGSSGSSGGGGSSSSSGGGGGGGGGGGAGVLKVTDCSLDRHIVFNHCSLSAIQVTCDSARSMEIAPLIVDKQIEISHGNETQSQVQAQSVTFSRRV